MPTPIRLVAVAALCTLAQLSAAQDTAAWRWVPIGGGGAIMTVDVSPHRNNVVLAGCDVGGVLRSDDYGRHWRICNRGLSSDGDRGVADFVWDPERPDVVFMASGACFGQPDGPYGGLWRSADEGRSWELVSREVRFSGFGSHRQWGNVLKINPRDGSLLAGTAWDGLMRSADGGRTWERLGVEGNFIVGVELGPPAPDTIYVAVLPTDHCEGAVWVTRDGGQSWRQALAGEQVRSVAVDPQRPGRAYAAVRDNGIMITEDFGETWRVAVNGIDGFLEKQWGNAVAINPLEPDTVYFCASERFGELDEWWRWRHPGLFVSQNRGGSWAPIIPGSMADGEFHQDAYMARVDGANWWKSKGWFAFNPMGWTADPVDGRHLYVHDFYGVWASDDGGENWRAAMDGLATTCVSAITCNPRRRDEAYIGLLDVGFFRTRDAGGSIEHWEFAYPSSNCTNLAIETRDGTEVIYSVVGGASLVLSEDAGETWRDAPTSPPEGARLGPVSLDSFRPHLVYCGRWRSPDGGSTWDEISSLPDGWNGGIVSDPTAEGRLYAWNEFEVFASSDGGESWADVSQGLPLVHAGKRRIRALSVMPQTGRVFAGSAAHGVFASDDHGANWRCVLPERYVTAVDCGADGRTIVAAAWKPWYAPTHEPGIFLSRDGGETWEQIDDGISGIARPACVALDPLVPGRIWLGTGGNAAFVGELVQ